MDDEPATDERQRVRILSTLESTRHASRPSRTKGGRRTSKSHRRSWLQGALWGAMGVGVLALMAGFVLVIQDSKPAIAQGLPAPTTIARTPTSAKRDTPVPSVEVTAPTAAGPAVIETTHADTPLAALSVEPTASSATVLATSTDAERVALNSKTNAAPAVKPAAATTSTPAAKTGKAGATAKGQDEDVALLEAMFAHTGRKPPPKPAAPKN
jgi:cytoskeletal protein RodZ